MRARRDELTHIKQPLWSRAETRDVVELLCDACVPINYLYIYSTLSAYTIIYLGPQNLELFAFENDRRRRRRRIIWSVSDACASANASISRGCELVTK